MLTGLFKRFKKKATAELSYAVDVSFMDVPIMQLSPYPEDTLTFRNLCEGTVIFGGIGSGKTSGSGKYYSDRILDAGFGGLVLCAKKDEVDVWLGRAEAHGRLDDVIVFDSESDCYFNFLDYECTRAGKGAGQTENIIHLFFTIMEAGNKGDYGKSDKFFEDSARDLMRNAIDLCKLSGEPITIKAMNHIILSAPEKDDPAPDLSKYCVQLLKRMSERNAAGELSPDQVHDKEITFEYWTQGFCELDDKTRSNIIATFNAFSSRFARGELYQRFCTKTTITPEATFSGKIIIMNYPIKEWGSVGEYAQVLFKTLWQDAIERRRVDEDTLPAFLWADECQFFLTSNDQTFLTTSRSARAITVFLSQNIPNFFAKLGSNNEAAVDSLLGNFQTKIFHQNADIKTNGWASSLIGTEEMARTSRGYSHNSAQDGIGTSSNTDFHREALVPPNTFATLRKGGMENNYEVDCLLYHGGRIWTVSNQCFLAVVFGQQAPPARLTMTIQ